jgi:hypothetical protein
MSFTPEYIRGHMHPNSDLGEGSHTGRAGLDLTLAKDNLYAFGKLWFSFDNRPAVAAFHGLMFGMVGDQRLKPLFGYTGFGLFQSKLLESGNVRIRGELTPEIPQFQFGDAPTLMNEGTIKTRKDGRAPFILPWERSQCDNGVRLNVFSIAPIITMTVGTDGNGIITITEAIELTPTDPSSSFNNYMTYNVSAVPVPAAAWLFGSALIGLAGIKRKK